LDSERWIEVKGKRTNKVKDSKTITASYSYPNNFKALATFTEPTPSPHTVPITDLQKLATTKKKNKHPTQKHVEHTLRLLAQQERAFLERSIVRAKNETTEIAKRDKHNKMCISANQNHRLSNNEVGWKQQTRNISASINGSLRRAVKKAKGILNNTKSVSFAPTRTVRTYQVQDIAAMITYDSGTDGHYLSEKDRKAIRLPILCASTKRVAVANGEFSKAKHVTSLPFKQLSTKATQADSFDDFPSSLMSVGKTSDDGTVSIFTKDGVTVHKEQDVLITCKGEPILIGIRDENGRYRIPLVQQKGQWQPRKPSKKARQTLHQANSVYDLPTVEQRGSNGCTQSVVIRLNLLG
jgi:hypothetical protein